MDSDLRLDMQRQKCRVIQEEKGSGSDEETLSDAIQQDAVEGKPRIETNINLQKKALQEQCVSIIVHTLVYFLDLLVPCTFSLLCRSNFRLKYRN